MMIFDEVHEDADRKIAEAITGFLFKTKFGRSFHHILEMPLFVSSAVTPAVRRYICWYREALLRK